MMIARNFEMLKTNGVTLRTVVEGKGPLVILLHGWPQCWYLWRHQIDPLVEAGFQVAVPDQRGYGGSDRPPAITDYNIRTLAADVAGNDVLLYDPHWRTTFAKAFDDLRFIEIVEGAGHWVQVEKPKETTALILRFLEGL